MRNLNDKIKVDKIRDHLQDLSKEIESRLSTLADALHFIQEKNLTEEYQQFKSNQLCKRYGYDECIKQ